jgi:hypothetical protein
MKSESQVQAEARLRAAALGWHLWRNNNGVLKDANGRPIRYGLANDSKALNKVVKSGDLIGGTPVKITADMVGQTLLVFTSVETKPEDFNGPSGKEEIDRYEAQVAWANLINSLGGRAYIVTDARQLG